MASWYTDDPPSSGGGASVDPSDDDPEALGAADPGTSDEYSRGDHVHPLPTPAEIGTLDTAGIHSVASGYALDAENNAIADAATKYTPLGGNIDGDQIQSGFVPDIHIPASITRDTELTAAINALATVYQPLDSDLTAIAALTTTTFGRSLLTAADAAAARALIGTGGARTTATYTTASLALNASDNAGSISMAKMFTAIRIQTTRAARVRIYATSAQRTADLSRAVGTDPTGDHGLLLEFVTTTDLDWAITPPAVGMSLESTPSASLPIAITNLDTTGTVGVTLTYLGAEA